MFDVLHRVPLCSSLWQHGQVGIMRALRLRHLRLEAEDLAFARPRVSLETPSPAPREVEPELTPVSSPVVDGGLMLTATWISGWA